MKLPAPITAAIPFLLGAALSGSACEKVAGIDSRQSVAASCAACLQKSCASIRGQCLAAPSCSERMTCLGRCSSPGCALACASEDASSSFEDTASFERCRATQCGAACGMSCGEPPLVVPEDVSADCARCLDTSCCAESKTCAQTQDCYEALECLRALPSPDGMASCLDVRYPSGSEAARRLLACQEGPCASRCAVGKQWSCLGKVSWANATEKEVPTRFRIIDFMGSAAVAGLDVKFCNRFDMAECKPFAEGITDENGEVSARLPTWTYAGLGGFAGYLEISDPSGGYYPELYFVNPPITQPGTLQEVPIGSRGSVEGIAWQAGVTLNPEAGNVVIRVRDCANRPAPGIGFSTSLPPETTRVVYGHGQFVSRSATETDAAGAAAIANVPPVPLVVKAKLVASDTAMAEGTLFVRPGVLSSIVLVPSP